MDMEPFAVASVAHEQVPRTTCITQSHKCCREAVGDERYLDRMLADFRLFCANDNGRLRQVAEQVYKYATSDNDL
jgi:hypothetical protein